MIAIIDYGMGNLRSVQKGFEKAGWEAAVVDRPEQLTDARGVVLPGVGAFNDAMARLRESGMDRAVHRVVAAGKPLLGICLGFQLFFEYSEEWGLTRGLGIFPGRVRRLTGGVKIPHMGWNHVRLLKPSPLMAGIPDQTAFYFVHSYYVDPADQALITGVTAHGIEFASMAGRDNVFGIQFHPEKSSAPGLQILQNFGGVAAKC